MRMATKNMWISKCCACDDGLEFVVCVVPGVDLYNVDNLVRKERGGWGF